MTHLNRVRAGFTLIELLVVIAIITILAAILFPVFSKAREKARQVSCTSNQRQIAISILMNAQENDEVFPGTTNWRWVFFTDRKILQCPNVSNNATSYTYNVKLSNTCMASISNPSSTVLTADGEHIPGNLGPSWVNGLTAWYSADTGVTADNNGKVSQWLPRTLPKYDGSDLAYGYYTATDINLRHNGKAIFSFVDGHTELLVAPPPDDDPGVGTPQIQNDPSLAPTLLSNGIMGRSSLLFANIPTSYLTLPQGVGIDFNRDEFTIVQVRDMVDSSMSTFLSAPGMVLRTDVFHVKYGPNPPDQAAVTFGAAPTTPTFLAVAVQNNGSSWNLVTTYAANSTFTNLTKPLAERGTISGIAPLYIGSDLNNWPAAPAPVSMQLSQLLFYKKALTNAEMATVYTMLNQNGYVP